MPTHLETALPCDLFSLHARTQTPKQKISAQPAHTLPSQRQTAPQKGRNAEHAPRRAVVRACTRDRAPITTAAEWGSTFAGRVLAV